MVTLNLITVAAVRIVALGKRGAGESCASEYANCGDLGPSIRNQNVLFLRYVQTPKCDHAESLESIGSATFSLAKLPKPQSNPDAPDT